MTLQHVIVGGGPAATQALETIRQFGDRDARITLICDEPAHSRMALPYWLADQIPSGHTHTADDGYFQRHGVETRLDVRATGIDPRGKTVTLANGESIGFDRLLLATGSSPARLSVPGADLSQVQPLWTLDDTQRLLDATSGLSQPRVALIGAGFVGLIVVNAMHKRGWKLVVVEREPYVLPRMLDEQSAQIAARWLTSRGVEVHTDASVEAIEETPESQRRLCLAAQPALSADVVLVATGVRPNVDLAGGTDVRTDHGILVDDHLRTNVPDIYAAGDVAQGPVLYDSRPAVHAIQTTAVEHGRVAGANMAGHQTRYPGSLLMNVLDVCGLQCASFGRGNDPDAEATTISNPGTFIYRKLVWQEDQLVGAIFTGRANDLGMLTDVGMVKGILQTQTRLGAWKKYLVENPFDVRRAYVGVGVAQKLAGTTLLGRPTPDRSYRFQDMRPQPAVGDSHAVLLRGRRA